MAEQGKAEQQRLQRMVDDQQDARYAAGAGQPLQAEEEAPAAAAAGEGGGEDVAAQFKKKKSKKKSKKKATEEDVSEGDDDKSNDLPPNPFTDGGGGGYSRSGSGRSLRSIDPDGGAEQTLGEVWEVSRPPGLVRDGGTDHGHFYVPAPTSPDGRAFRAFLNNSRYATRATTCVDWRAWMRNHPSSTLIHFSEVPREAVAKGRHLLAVRPGSAFFSAAQMSLDGASAGYGDREEAWEDSGSYAQMFVNPPSSSARGIDAESVLTDDRRAFREWRRGGRMPPPGRSVRSDMGGGGGSGGGGYTASGRSYSSVSPLRKGFYQNIIAGMVAFAGPGLFNALQGLGNAGGSDPTVAATMNAVLYATFSFFGVLSGSLFNLMGTKILMSFGASMYGFYAISVYLWGQDDKYAIMAIIASALLGLGAACLWGAQGTMTLSYALENQKGLFFGIFWLIFNMGGVMGGFITLGVNSGDEERATSIAPETYYLFCSLMLAGAVMAFFFVIRPSRVVKSDGSSVEFNTTDAKEGLGELREVSKLFCNRYMLLLTPLIIQSNWFYAYEFGGINGLLFDAPTRGLNSAMYWLVSGISSYVCGTYFLDRESLGNRRQRGILGLIVISIINLGQWAYAIYYQFDTGYDKGNAPDPPINYRDGTAYALPAALFIYCGLADSLVQTYAYWIIGAISNTPKTLSRFVGYYKGIQSFGACLAWIIEAQGVSYRAQLLVCSVLATAFIFPTYLVAKRIQDDSEGGDEEFDEKEPVLRAEGDSYGYI